MLNYQQIYMFGRIQTSPTGGQLKSDTSPYVECSLPESNRSAKNITQDILFATLLHLQRVLLLLRCQSIIK